MKLKWMARARHDLGRICDYIEKHDPQAAWRISQEIKSAALKLRDFPHLGRMSDDIGVRLLQVAGRPYVLLYRLSGEFIEILAVFDQRRNPEDMH